MRVWRQGNGPKPWRVRGYDATGRKVQQSFGTRGEADEFDRQEETKKARARAGLPVQQRSVTLRELYDLFIENSPEKQSSEWFGRMMRRPLDEFGHVPVRTLRPDELGRWLHALPLSAKTKTHILTCARQVTAAGLDWGYLERDPLRPGAVRGPGAKRARPIRPFESWDEVVRVCRALGRQREADFVRFVCLTGLSVPSEALGLTWNDYDSSAGRLHVRGTKTENRDRTIPLSRPAQGILESLPPAIPKSRPIFEFNYHQWRKVWWPKALDEAGLARRTPYEMRHTFATLALERGVPIETVSKLLGHADITITLRYYAKFTRRKLEADVALMDTITEEDANERSAEG